MAVASLITGMWALLSFVSVLSLNSVVSSGHLRQTCSYCLWCSLLISMLASIILGYLAQFFIRRSSGRLVGHGMATAGIYLGMTPIFAVSAFLAYALGVPLFIFLMIAGAWTIVKVWQSKRPWFWRAAIGIVGILVIYYAVFEYIPGGDIRENQEIRGIPFRKLVGNYYHGDGLGVNCSMQITASSRFYFTWTGCMGLYDRNKGQIRIAGEFIELIPKKQNIQEGFRGTPTLFMPVLWGDRTYLVPKGELVNFCSKVNAGQEPRDRPHGRFYLRHQDWSKRVTGTPNVPAEFQGYLLKTPVRGKIIAVQDNGTTGVLNLGTRDGLLEGMTLTAHSMRGANIFWIKVMQTKETNSVVKCSWKNDKLLVGQTVTSKTFDVPDHFETTP